MRSQRLLSSLCLALAVPMFANAVLAQGAKKDDASEYEDPGASEYEEPTEGKAGDKGAGEKAPDAAKPVEKAPAKGKGAIVGQVLEANGEPAIEALITISGQKKPVATDIDGNFRIELPPGSYQLTITYNQAHKAASYDGIEVKAGKTERFEVKLESSGVEIETTEVKAKVDTSGVEGQMLARQKSAAVGDGISRAEMAKNPDSNAAEASKRVPGATIVGGRFVYVRGLGERYSNALANGSPLPSPEPDKAAVPLDVFPAGVLDDITIIKTATADSPADFAGGSVRLTTRGVPEKFIFTASLGIGFNTNVTFQDRLGYNGGKRDWLGFDDGNRAIPDGVPGDRALNDNSDPNQLALGRQINTIKSFSGDYFTPPQHNIGFAIGNGWKLPGGQEIGAFAALSYSRKWERARGVVREFAPAPNSELGLGPLFDYQTEHAVEAVRLGGYGSLAYKPAPGHELKLTGIYSRLADIGTRTVDGRNSDAVTLYGARLYFHARQLANLTLSGSHAFPELAGGALAWSAGTSSATRAEPDTRDIVYTLRPQEGIYEILDGSETARHFFSDQSERGLYGNVDWTQPLNKAETLKLKFGGATNRKSRDFRARRFNFNASSDADFTEKFCPNNSAREGDCAFYVITPDRIGPVFLLNEYTQAADSYSARLDVIAGYVMADLELTKQLRVIFGPRVERTIQTLGVTNVLNQTGTIPGGADLTQTNLLPSAAVVVSAGKSTKWRASVAKTLARPQLRELAPFAFNDYFGGLFTSGNPNLKLTEIMNYDLRLEHFPTLREVLAASVFYKRFKDPIEPVLLVESGAVSRGFRNAPGASLMGVEFEGRKSLGFVCAGAKGCATVMEDFSIVSNLTIARSQILLNEESKLAATNAARPMANQAPWVVNLILDYENKVGTKARILYNISGPRLVAAGVYGLDDSYLHPQGMLDATVGQDVGPVEVKLEVENILNTEYLVTVGKDERTAADGSTNVRERFRSGVGFMLGATYKY